MSPARLLAFPHGFPARLSRTAFPHGFPARSETSQPFAPSTPTTPTLTLTLTPTIAACGYFSPST